MELTDTQLTFLSTLAWLVLTSIGFVVLVRWSIGDPSWTVLPGLVRGVRSWAEDRTTPPEPSPAALASPRAVPGRRPSADADADAEAEIIDL